MMFVAFLSAVALGVMGGVGSTDSTSCATTCPDTNKFNLMIGWTYEYAYRADMVTSMVGSSEEHSGLHLSAVANIEVLSKCELALRLEDVVLQDSRSPDVREYVPHTRAFSAALQSKPLRFGWLDGEVERVCPEEEPAWVLNVKRGVISHLQNTMDRFDTPKDTLEVDIFGRCQVSYHKSNSVSLTNTITKVKDIQACRHDNHHTAFLFGLSLQGQSAVPLVDSTHACEQVVTSEEAHVTRVTCRERHQVRPFSAGGSGAVTEVTTSLDLRGVSPRVRTHPGAIPRHTNLMYDPTLAEEELIQTYHSAKDTLDHICSTMTDDVRPEVPALFMKLVKDMRKLDISNLIKLNGRAERRCDIALKFFRNAVGKLGTSASVNVMRQLIDSEKATAWEADAWLTTLPFISAPSLAVLSEAAALLPLTGGVRKRAHLAVSSLVNNYCQTHAECAAETTVQNIISVFEDDLGHNCKANHDQVLLALKSLGNAGIARRSAAILNRCFLADDVDTDIRVEAMKAFHRLPFSVDRSELVTMYMDIRENAELRINAFLQLIKCASGDVINHVRTQLQSEEVNQVGSFVWTYLTNHMETSDPLSQEITGLLTDDTLAVKYEQHLLRFSSHVKSQLAQLLHAGGSVERSVVWLEDSFLPSSAVLNLTVDVFGEPLNLLEIGARLQGVGGLIQRVFGSEAQSQENNQPSSFDASFYLKAMGNEIQYQGWHGSDLGDLQSSLDYEAWLRAMAEDRSVQITDSSILLSAQALLPTVTGMPLRLSAEGASTVNLKLGGRIDLTSITTKPYRVHVYGSIEPSAAVDVTCDMGVDAWVAQTGVKMVTTLHSSTVASGQLEFEQDRILNIDINMPRDRLEVFSAQSKFYISHRAQDYEQRMNTDKVVRTNECVDLTRALGISLCAEASVPISTRHDVPPTPFTGPISVALYGVKTDIFDKYHFHVSLQEDRGSRYKRVRTSTLQVTIDTPGSTVNREMSFYAMVDHLDFNTTVQLRSPWKQASLILNRDNMTMTVDQHAYSLSFFSISRHESFPDLVLFWPSFDEQPRVIATLMYDPDTSREFHFKLMNVFEGTLEAFGNVTLIRDGGHWKSGLALRLQAPFFSGDFDGFIDLNGSSSLEAGVNAGVDERRRVTGGVAYTATLHGNTRTVTANYRLHCPRYNIDHSISLDHMNTNEMLNHTLEFDFGNAYTGLYETTLRQIDQRRNSTKYALLSTLQCLDFAPVEMNSVVETQGRGQFLQTGTLRLSNWRWVSVFTEIKLDRAFEFTTNLVAPDMPSIVLAINIDSLYSDVINSTLSVTNLPIRGFENVQMYVSHRTNGSVYTTSGDMSWGRGQDKTLTYTQDLTIIPGSKYGVVAHFRSPFPGYQDLRLDSVVERNGDTYSTHNEFQWAEARVITLVSAFAIDLPYLNARLRFTSPFESYERIVTSVSNQIRSGIWISHFDMEYAPTKNVEFNSQIDLTNYRKLFIEIISEACPWIGTAKLDAELIYNNMRNHQFRFELASSRLLKHSIMLTTDVDFDYLRRLEGRLHYRSPIGLKSMEIALKSVHEYRVGLKSSTNFTIPAFRFRWYNDLVHHGDEEASLTSVFILQDDQYRLLAYFDSSEMFRLFINSTLYSPHGDWMQVQYEANGLTWWGSSRNYTATFDVSFGPNITPELHIRHVDTTTGMESIDFQCLGVLGKDLRMHAVQVRRSDEQSYLNIEYGRSHAASGDISELVSRVADYFPVFNDEIFITFNYTGSYRDFTSGLVLGVNYERWSSDLTYRQQGDVFNQSLAISTPWDVARTVYLEASHNVYTQPNEHIALNEHIVHNEHFQLDNHNEPGEQSELDEYIEREEHIEHTLTALAFMVQGADWEFSHSTQNDYSLRGYCFGTETTIQTPVEGYEMISTDYVQNGSWTAFRTSGQISVSGQTASFKKDFYMIVFS